MSIAFEGKIDGEYRHIKALFAPHVGLRYAAERRTATALRPLTGCALHFAGRYVSVAWARLRLRLDPPPC